MGAHHNHSHSSHPKNQRRLLFALAIAAAYMVAEFVAGFLTGSLALLADAGHMLSDVAALGLSFFALRMARRAPTATLTYGFHRTEILVALANGATLLIIASMILKEAWERITAAPAIPGLPMILVAIGGLVANLLGLWILHSGKSTSLNIRGAYLHVMADALGSVGAIAAGAAIYFFRWYWADPAISALIALLVAFSSFHLVRQSIGILMEAVPSGMDIQKIDHALSSMQHVKAVHDLHVWSITTGKEALSAHLVISPETDGPTRDQLLASAQQILHDQFGIEHATLQIGPTSQALSSCHFDSKQPTHNH